MNTHTEPAAIQLEEECKVALQGDLNSAPFRVLEIVRASLAAKGHTLTDEQCEALKKRVISSYTPKLV